MSFRNTILKAWFSRRARAIDRFRRHPIETQERMFRYLLRRGRMTEFGDRYNLRHIHTVEQFQTQVETFDYDTFKTYVERMLEGIRSVTSPGRVTLFARSSGTTSDRSKYIPVTRDSLWWNHTLGMRDVATLYAAAHPKTRAFEGKTLTLGGSCTRQNLLEVWPQLEMFAHGGVEFTPYRQSFRELLPSDDFVYMETYNASEGFFALADDPARDDMLLMLDYGTFYEFRDGERIVPLEGVECGRVYAMLITSINGLWRYEIGDTVEFTSTAPYRIRFAGRTRQYINVFGEELIVDNADRALLDACSKTGAVVAEYTVAPCYMSLRERGAHEWVVEFEREPADPERFAGALDEALRRVNSDYDAKRRTTLERQRIHTVGRGYFLRWMRARGKNKVPRLMNDRRVIEDVLAFGREAEAAGEGTAC